MRPLGFTLIELLVIMTIGAILLAAAVPSFSWLIARSRISDTGSVLTSHLEYARMEATRRSAVISLCRSTNADAAGPACSSAIAAGYDGNDWAAGWIVFEKSGGGVDEAKVEAGDRILLRQPPVAGTSRVMVRTNIPGAERIAFPPRGAGGVIGAGTIALDYGSPPPPVANRAPASVTLTTGARCIAVSPPLGAVRSYRATGGVCR
jgi:type IV fimbrial biogenesis protein FimT